MDHLGRSSTKTEPHLEYFKDPSHEAHFTIRPVIPQCLTGGSDGGVHCTDVTNASRTMLFNIHTLDWDAELCRSAASLWLHGYNLTLISSNQRSDLRLKP